MSEHLVALYILLGGAAVVTGVSAVPPLTEGGLALNSPAAEQATVASAEERSFCQANTPGLNCHCFSQVSGHILSADQPQIYGYQYANKSDLARSQASKSC